MEEKQNGKLGTVLFWGIPLVITAVVAVLVINFLGIPLGQTFQAWGKKIPVVGQFIPDPSTTQANSGNSQDDWKQKYSDSSAKLKADDQKIADLTKELNDNQKTIQDMKQNSLELQNQQQKKATQQAQDQMKQVAGIYANMPPSKAAAMIEALPLEDASLTMSMLQQDQQSNIFSSMKDARKAAQITMILKDISGIGDMDPGALKDQIHQIAQSEQNPTDSITNTLAAMPPTQSAGIIQTMMGTNSQEAISLLKSMSTDSSSQILAEIEKTNAKLAAQITAGLNN